MTLLLSMSCAGNSPLLIVNLRTDFVPRVEFSEVRIFLFRGSGNEEVQTYSVTDLDYVRGQRVADFRDIAPGDYRVRAELLSPDGRIIGRRTLSFTLSQEMATTVVITRSCEGVVCPAGDPAATECSGGRCVPPECTPETPWECGAGCIVDGDCPAAEACAEPLCTLEGSCVFAERPGICPDPFYCDPTLGCIEGPEFPDAGRRDVGPRFDGSIPDAGPSDVPLVDAECGNEGAACCPSAPTCNGILVCRDGACRACGREGDPCCLGDACSTGFTCNGGTCEGCGSPGLSCCPGSPCPGGGNCVDGTCIACGSAAGTCLPGTMESRMCGNCGMQNRICTEACTWDDWGTCGGEGVCAPGARENDSCGNCGSRDRTCDGSCRWGPWTPCGGEGECSPGSMTAAGCGTCQARECSSSCELGACTGCTCASSVTQCGSSCPSGYHPSSRNCNFSCGSCSGGSDNQTTCRPDCGTSFSSCGSSCADGYYVASRNCNFACGSCSGGSDNSVNCRMYDSNFTRCGFGCPEGWYISARSCNFACGSCSGGSDNASTCRQLDGSTFTACGSSCPSGYSLTGRRCSFSCGSCSFGGDNSVTCRPL